MLIWGILAGAGMVIALATVVVLLLTGSNDGDADTKATTSTEQRRQDTTSTSSASSTTAVRPTTTVAPRPATTIGPPTTPPPTAPPSTVRPDVSTLQSGLLCRDLHGAGYSYAEAMSYWQREGFPSRMDEDGNGIACETVYPTSEVEAFHGSYNGTGSGVTDEAEGLFCRDLYAMGYSYSEAYEYWEYWGEPERMDEDLNGVPCETVYP